MTGKPSHLYVVLWNGHYNELESTAAIAFSEADAQAVIARAPEQPARYSVDRWPLATFLSSAGFGAFADQVRARIGAGDLSPILISDPATRDRGG